MPFSCEFVEGGRGLVFSGSGLVTAGEIVTVKIGLKERPEALRQVAYALVDFQSVNELRVSLPEIELLTGIDQELAQLLPAVALAVVAPGNHVFGVSRMWESYLDLPGWSVRVFRSASEASAWLHQAQPGN